MLLKNNAEAGAERWPDHCRHHLPSFYLMVSYFDPRSFQFQEDFHRFPWMSEFRVVGRAIHHDFRSPISRVSCQSRRW